VIFQSTTPAATPGNAVEIPGKACDASKSGYLNSGSGSVANLAACSQSCQKSAQCQSVTFYASKWCSHFSTTCRYRVTNSGATSVIFQSAITQPATYGVFPGKACDGKKSGYVGGKMVADIVACEKACRSHSNCKSLTFYASKWCSSFSYCDGFVTDSGAISVKFPQRGIQPTTPANGNIISGKACDGKKSGYVGGEMVADLGACEKACRSHSNCKRVTFYASKWCSIFSYCSGLVDDRGATVLTVV